MLKIIATLVLIALLHGDCYAVETTPKCGPREVFRPCGSLCPATCRFPQPAATSCVALPGCKDACFCKEPFVRNENTNKCVRRCHCPRQ